MGETSQTGFEHVHILNSFPNGLYELLMTKQSSASAVLVGHQKWCMPQDERKRIHKQTQNLLDNFFLRKHGSLMSYKIVRRYCMAGNFRDKFFFFAETYKKAKYFRILDFIH